MNNHLFDSLMKKIVIHRFEQSLTFRKFVFFFSGTLFSEKFPITAQKCVLFNFGKCAAIMMLVLT